MKKTLIFLILFLTAVIGGGFEKGFEEYKKDNLLKAEKIWLECAKKEKSDDLRCTYSLAVLYDEVLNAKKRDLFNTTKDKNLKKYQLFNYTLPELYEKAIFYYKKVAKEGYEVAYAPLGLLYYTGVNFMNLNVVEPNYKEALKWLLKASNSRDKKYVLYSDNIIGLIYFEGKDVLQDYKKAEGYFKKAIKNRVTVAKCNLGYLYLKQGKIALAKRYLKEGYKDGESYCAQIWNSNGLGR